MVYITRKGTVCMRKKASRIGDFGLTGIGSYLTAQMIPGVSSVANTAGGVAGALHDNAKKEVKSRGHAAKSLLPGVGAYRQGVIARAVADESGERGKKQLLHEMIGSRLSMFGTGMAGAAGGAYLGSKIGDGEHKVPLAVAGGITGLAAPSVLAAVVALSTKTRSKRDQDKSEKRNLALNYIPGFGDYQYMKRLGRGYDKYFDKKAGDESMNHLRDAIQKKAAAERIGDWGYGAIGDSALGAVVPGGQLVGTVGALKGLIQDDAKKDLKERGSNIKGLLPGVGAYRQGRVMRAVADESGDRGRKQLLHEVIGSNIGSLASGAAGAAAGAGIGAATGGTDDDMLMGGVIGGVSGMLLPELAAGVLALVKKTRTKKEQSEHEEEGNLAKNYIPGVGSYNMLKRLGSGYDRYFEGKEKINKNAGDQSMGHLVEAIIGQTSEPRKQAVRDLLNKEAADPGQYWADRLKEHKGADWNPERGFGETNPLVATQDTSVPTSDAGPNDFVAAPSKAEIDAYRKKMNKPAPPTTLGTTVTGNPNIKAGVKVGKAGNKLLNPLRTAGRVGKEVVGFHKDVKQAAKGTIKAEGQRQLNKLRQFGKGVKQGLGIGKEGSDRKDAVRGLIYKFAAEKCGENGHYCEECGKYGESTKCDCGYDCGCGVSKEAGDYSCPTCGTACPTCKDGVKKEANDKLLMTRGQYAKGMEKNQQPSVDAKGKKSQALKDAIAARNERMAASAAKKNPKKGTFNKLKGKDTQQSLRQNMYK